MFAVACQTSVIAQEWDDGSSGGPFPVIYDPNASASSSVNIGSLFLFNQSGGAVAYIGENLVMGDDAGTGFMGYLFTEQANGYVRLGDMYRMAQQDYFNANFYNPAYDTHFSPRRLYLGTMVLLVIPPCTQPRGEATTRTSSKCWDAKAPGGRRGFHCVDRASYRGVTRVGWIVQSFLRGLAAVQIYGARDCLCSVRRTRK